MIRSILDPRPGNPLFIASVKYLRGTQSRFFFFVFADSSPQQGYIAKDFNWPLDRSRIERCSAIGRRNLHVIVPCSSLLLRVFNSNIFRRLFCRMAGYSGVYLTEYSSAVL